MSDAFPPSTSSSHVSATASLVRYPPEYFCSGAAGFRHVSTVLNDLALAASSAQTALPSARYLPLTTGPQLNGQRVGDKRTLRRRGAPAPYSAMRDSWGYSTWGALINSIPFPSRERITATYPGCCDGINVGDYSTLRKHQFSAIHTSHLKDEDLQYIPIGLCPACPEDLGCRDEGQRVDIYGQKGRHFDTCAAYRALCERTNTKPEPILTNRATVKALLEERDRLRIALGFRTPKNVSPTFPITPLPLLTPVAHAFLLESVYGLNRIEPLHPSSGSASMPFLALSPSWTTCSRVLTPTEQSDLQNDNSSLPLIPNPSPAPLDGTMRGDSHGTRNLDVSFPAYFHLNNAQVSEWESAPNLATPVRPDLSLSANAFKLGANSNPLGAITTSRGKRMTNRGLLANLGTDTTEDLDFHPGIFQEEDTTVDVQVKGGSGPFLSPGEGPPEMPPPESSPVYAAQ